jgi:hypothetical protein
MNKQLREIDVSKYTEKKNGLTYLSWAWAVDQLLLADPKAHWFYPEFQRWGNGTVMVFCTVVANDIARTAQLPVMDYRNKPVSEPDSFAVNTAMQRCLAKAIALHGIGLYIYNGEDVPPELGADIAVSKPASTKVGVTPPPAPKTAPTPPAKTAPAPKQESNAWQLLPQAEEGTDAWIEAVKGGVTSILQLATTPDDVANIFKKNRVIFDKVKEIDADCYKDLLEAFKKKKDSLK